MNIAIFILSIIDTILIYIIDIINGEVKDEILIDLLGGAFFVLLWLKIYDYYEKTVIMLKWDTFISLILVLFGILFAIIGNKLSIIQLQFSAVIPLYLSYYGVLIKQKLEDNYII